MNRLISHRSLFKKAISQSARHFSSSGASTVGFIGLGNMGKHMANNVLKAGNKVVVFDISDQAIEDVVKNGGIGAGSAAEVASQASTIITMLPSSQHVRDTYTSSNGVFSTLQPNSLLIDSSTIDPSTAKEVAQMANSAHQSMMVDAPVSGGVIGAENATLTFMVGGSDAEFARAKEVLSMMGTNTIHCGGHGTGQVAKIANNLVLAISMVAVSEGMNLGIKGGMDPKILASIFNTSTARCWSTDTYNPCPGVMEGVPSSRGYTGGFGVDLMRKDLGLALTAAQDSHAALPVGQLVQELFTKHSEEGNGKLDFSSIFKLIEKSS